jgi:hypothetical protein
MYAQQPMQMYQGMQMPVYGQPQMVTYGIARSPPSGILRSPTSGRPRSPASFNRVCVCVCVRVRVCVGDPSIYQSVHTCIHTQTNVIKYNSHSLMRHTLDGDAADDAADAVILIHPSTISLRCLHLVQLHPAVSETGNFML